MCVLSETRHSVFTLEDPIVNVINLPDPTQIKLCDGLNEQNALLCYMPPKKFKRFLNNGLSLTRADLFTNDDPFEGEFTREIYDFSRKFSFNGQTGKKVLKNQCDAIRKHTFVSCWTDGEKENVALWRLYGGNGNGVAVKTTATKLTGELIYTLNKTNGKSDKILKYFNKRVVKVQYFDHNSHEDRGKMLDGRATDILHFKNIGYHYEDEIRVIFDSYQGLETGNGESRFGESITIKIRPEEVIEEVLISPYGCTCYSDSIKKMMKEFNLETKVKWSTLKWVPESHQ